MENRIIKILLIEDDEEEVFLIKEILSEQHNMQYELIQANALDKGIELLNSQDFDVILLDIGLPDSQGLDTLKKVVKCSKSITIIILTGFDDFKSSLAALEIGAQDYLVKGTFSSELLCKSVKYAIKRKEAELEIYQKESQLRHIIACNADAIIIVNMQGSIVFANPSAEALFGKSNADLLGLPFLYSLNREKQEIEILRNEERIVAEICCAPIIWKNKDAYLASIRDISDRKKTEEKLKKSEERLHMALKGAKLGTWVLDLQSEKITYSERCTEIMGHHLKKHIHVDFNASKKYIHPDDLKKLYENLEKFLKEEIDHYECELRVKHKSGIWIWVLIQAQVFEKSYDNMVSRIVGTCLDINARKYQELKSEELINTLKGELNLQQFMEGYIPICSSCFKIKTNANKWIPPDKYFRDIYDIGFSHGICPNCLKTLYPEFYERLSNKLNIETEEEKCT